MIESQHDVHLVLPVEVDEDAAADSAVEAGPKALQHSHGLLPLASRPQTLNATGVDSIYSDDSASDAVAECEVEANSTVRVITFSTQNCAQTGSQSTRPLPHMNLNVSERLIWALWGLSRSTDRVTG